MHLSTDSTMAILLPDLRPGGAERVGVNIANTLSERGHRVEMVLMAAIGELRAELSPAVTLVDLHCQRTRGVLWALMKYLRRARPAVVLANMWPLTVLTVLASRLTHAKTRVVVAEHTTWSHSELLDRGTLEWQISNSMRMAFPWAEAIVTVSNGAADDLARFAKIRRDAIEVIYNPVVGLPGASSGEPQVPRGWWFGEHPRLLAVGTLKAIKDFGSLIQAIHALRHQSNARLLIVGEGQERPNLAALIREYRLEERVFLHGYVSDPRPFYARADLFVLSSLAEGFGNVIVEALAEGTPVVATDCPSGPREILENGKFGRLVPPANPAALAEAILDALRAPPNRPMLITRAQEFSISKAVDHYEKILFPACRNAGISAW